MNPQTNESKSPANDNYPLCRDEELSERSAKAISLPGVGANGKVENCPLILVRWENKVYGYINTCPHTPVQLDARIPGHFFNEEHSYLMCDKHGALFEVDTGECFDGPCQGKGLTRLNVEVIDGSICLVGVKMVDVADDASE